MSFADLGLSPETIRAVEEKGYTEPTPIQAQAIPIVLMGRDVLGIAQTGTGKTAGFTLPMIDILASGRAKARMPRSLILAPTRELAHQVADNFKTYGAYHKLSMALLIGGESLTEQEKSLDRGVDVLIATPGRLIDLFERGRILLRDVKILVIDEADRMLDMGFMPDVERIVSLLPKIRQTLLFSATMAPEIRRMADAFLINPKQVSVDRETTAAETVEQGLVVVGDKEKRDALAALIRAQNVRNAFIFCNRKRDIGTVHRHLERNGLPAVMLHGDMPQPVRTETLARFKSGEASLMVCSDVAARGLDVADVSHVFNFDVPTHAEDYVHRIGRTGRAGRTGHAFTIATPGDAKYVTAIEQLLGKPIPRHAPEGVEPRDLDEAPPVKGRERGSRRSSAKPDKPSKTAEPAEQKKETERKETSETSADGPVKSRPARKPEARAPRRRGRGDPDVKEMDHADDVVAFGDHMPDFMARTASQPDAEKPVPPSPRSKGRKSAASAKRQSKIQPTGTE